jgi:hypothetical protein
MKEHLDQSLYRVQGENNNESNNNYRLARHRHDRLFSSHSSTIILDQSFNWPNRATMAMLKGLQIDSLHISSATRFSIAFHKTQECSIKRHCSFASLPVNNSMRH